MDKQDHSSSNTSRSGDVKAAFVLCGLTVFFIIYTLGFPMSGSYGGVENQWYVSPALFPLAILIAMLLCSTILLFQSVKTSGLNTLLSIKHWVGDVANRKTRDVWLIIFLLVSYVYFLIPFVDFYLATIIFLLSLTLRFYTQYDKNAVVVLMTHSILALVIIGLRITYTEEGQGFFDINNHDRAITFGDAMTGFAAFALLLFNIIALKRNETPRYLPLIFTTLLFPLVITIIFTFVLYVTMPVEYGSISTFLNYLVYDVVGL